MPVSRRDRELIAAYAAGASLRQLARKYNISYKRVWVVLKQNNVDMRMVGPQRDPMFDIVIRRAHGTSVCEIAALYSKTASNIYKKIINVGAQRRKLRPLLTLSSAQLAVYREALDTDRLNHEDALEIAVEY